MTDGVNVLQPDMPPTSATIQRLQCPRQQGNASCEPPAPHSCCTASQPSQHSSRSTQDNICICFASCPATYLLHSLSGPEDSRCCPRRPCHPLPKTQAPAPPRPLIPPFHLHARSQVNNRILLPIVPRKAVAEVSHLRSLQARSGL